MPPSQRAAFPWAPTPSLFSSSPQHELPVVSAGMPTPAAASPGCAASPVRSASWAGRTVVITMCKRTSAHSGPAAGPLWNCPAGLPLPVLDRATEIRLDIPILWIVGYSALALCGWRSFFCSFHWKASQTCIMSVLIWSAGCIVLLRNHHTCRVLSRRCRLETLWRTCCWKRESSEYNLKNPLRLQGQSSLMLPYLLLHLTC